MRPPLQISSPSNQTIKDLVRLKERKSDRCERSFIVEGRREIERALSCGYRLEELYYCPDELEGDLDSLLKIAQCERLAEVSKQAFSKVATREGSDGLIALFEAKTLRTEDISSRAKGEDLFVMVLENVEKPGNLGAVLRTADAIGVHGVILLGHEVDIWNPNVIRSSLGGVFSVPVVYLSNDRFFSFCRENKLSVVAAALTQKSSSLLQVNLKGPLAIVLGSEAHGISDEVLRKSDHQVLIPMLGVCDSLNVSVAAGIFAFEAMRQRRQT